MPKSNKAALSRRSRESKTQYTRIARMLHWLVAGLIITQYILAELAEYAEHSDDVVGQLGLLANHKSIGMTILGLAILRVLWRFFNKPAALPDSLSDWQYQAANAMHWLLYFLIFALPITGWLMSSSYGYSVSWFNLFTFTDLISTDKPLAATLNDVHELLGNVLLALAVLHVLAALKHRFVDNDGVLQRMATSTGWLVLFASIAISLWAFGRIVPPHAASNIVEPFVTAEQPASEVPNDTIEKEIESSADVPPLMIESSLPVWEINYADSYIRFSGDQAGAPFQGEWQRWKAQMQFDSTRLDESQFRVEIDTASAFSNDEERDGYIAGEDFFSAKQHPQALFEASRFKRLPDGSYTVSATLMMKSLSNPIDFSFSVNQRGTQVELLGNAVIDRLAWNIGMGDWADPTWVGHEVTVSVRVIASTTTQDDERAK